MSEAMIHFSVVIPLYNKKATVERALRSVFNQTVQDFEIIIVNDGSTDNGARIVEAIGDSRIHLIHQDNQGVSAARNRGVAEARYELIAFLDADDEWLPEFLDVIRRMVIQYPGCGLYATSYFLRLPSGRQQSAIIRGLPIDFEGILENYFQIAVRSHPPVWTGAACIRKSALLQIGGFPVGVTVGEDLITWAKLRIRNKIAYCSLPKAIFHLRSPIGGTPLRLPDKIDIVGDSLKGLFPVINKTELPYFEKYIALWHRMRSAVFFRAGKFSEGRSEVKKMVEYSDKNWKLFLYLVIAFSPERISKIFIMTMYYFRRLMMINGNRR